MILGISRFPFVRLRVWANACLSRFGLASKQFFFDYCLLPYCYRYKRDFFRNNLWEVMDEPAPIETVLQFIRRYGHIPPGLLMRIYFYEAKKKRRTYKSIERAMTRRIRKLKIRARRPNIYETGIYAGMWGHVSGGPANNIGG